MSTNIGFLKKSMVVFCKTNALIPFNTYVSIAVYLKSRIEKTSLNEKYDTVGSTVRTIAG